ncbi:MAG: hypothetical protein R3C16_10025 [Hyphomonadaceae bacterium]
MSITGATAICFTLAHPVAHVRTPAAFNALAARNGADVVMVPLEVAAADLGAFLATMRRMANVNGAVVTVPHKSAAVAYCDEVSQRAQQCGAVNVIRREGERLIGDMFDGLGFVTGLRKAGHDVAERNVLLVGAGGAARAIAFELAASGVARLGIANRTAQRAQALAERVREAYPRVEAFEANADPTGFDVIVNGTSLGLKPGDALPVDVAKLTPAMLVAEVVMQPERTALIAAAAAAGARTHRGLAMLEAQLDLIADFLGAGPSPGARR